MLSIVIPTLNEEEHLPKLLESIKEQEFDDYEIIVADADSEDATRKIAEDHGCEVVEGGIMAVGRNRGAEAARGNLLLFVDADVTLPEDFLNEALREFSERKLDGGCFFIYPATRNFWHKIIFNLFYNYPIKFVNRILPHGSMTFLVKKDIHNKIGGFDENIVFLEDLDYVRRLAKAGKYRLQSSVFIFTSVRRFKEHGWIRSYLRLLVGDVLMLFGKTFKENIFNYKFDEYNHES